MTVKVIIEPKILQGSYTKRHSTLEKDGCKLLVSKRTNPTKDKSELYLLHIDDNGKRHYVSSLYPRGKNVYKLDYQGVTFFMTVENEHSVTIKMDGYGW